MALGDMAILSCSQDAEHSELYFVFRSLAHSLTTLEKTMSSEPLIQWSPNQART